MERGELPVPLEVVSGVAVHALSQQCLKVLGLHLRLERGARRNVVPLDNHEAQVGASLAYSRVLPVDERGRAVTHHEHVARLHVPVNERVRRRRDRRLHPAIVSDDARAHRVSLLGQRAVALAPFGLELRPVLGDRIGPPRLEPSIVMPPDAQLAARELRMIPELGVQLRHVARGEEHAGLVKFGREHGAGHAQVLEQHAHRRRRLRLVEKRAKVARHAHGYARCEARLVKVPLAGVELEGEGDGVIAASLARALDDGRWRPVRVRRACLQAPSVLNVHAEGIADVASLKVLARDGHACGRDALLLQGCEDARLQGGGHIRIHFLAGTLGQDVADARDGVSWAGAQHLGHRRGQRLLDAVLSKVLATRWLGHIAATTSCLLQMAKPAMKRRYSVVYAKLSFSYAVASQVPAVTQNEMFRLDVCRRRLTGGLDRARLVDPRCRATRCLYCPISMDAMGSSTGTTGVIISITRH